MACLDCAKLQMSGAVGYCSLIMDNTLITLQGTHKELSFVPSHIRDDAVSGNYVNLEEFLPQEFLSPRNNAITIKHNPGTDRLVFHHSLPSQPIENLTQWMMAWNNYECVLVNSNSDIYFKLLSYRETILKCSQKFKWTTVYIYDQRFRAKLATTHSFNFDSIDHDLYVTIFDGSAVRSDVPRCHRCKSFYHKVTRFCNDTLIDNYKIVECVLYS